MLVLGLGLVLKESLRTIFMALALALALQVKSWALALALKLKSLALALALQVKSLLTSLLQYRLEQKPKRIENISKKIND